MIEEIAGRTKCGTIENDKWGRKEYRKESNSGTIKDIIKIRLHMWELEANYGQKGLDNRCPVCQSERDTTEYVLERNKGDKEFNLNDERRKEWGGIVEIYRKNKENRSIDNIREEQNILEQKKREENKRQKLREDRRRYKRRRKYKKKKQKN